FTNRPRIESVPHRIPPRPTQRLESVSCHGPKTAVRPEEVVTMSASAREPVDDRGIELGTGVSWPHILAGAGLGLGGLTAVVLLGLLAVPNTPPEREPALAPWAP